MPTKEESVAVLEKLVEINNKDIRALEESIATWKDEQVKFERWMDVLGTFMDACERHAGRSEMAAQLRGVLRVIEEARGDRRKWVDYDESRRKEIEAAGPPLREMISYFKMSIAEDMAAELG